MKVTAHEVWTSYQRAYDAGHDTYIGQAELYNNYYLGNQWSEEDLQKLSEKKLPHITMNLVLSTLNAVQGEQRRGRVEPIFKPRNPTDADGAKLRTQLFMHVMDDNDGDQLLSGMFDDGLIEERGYLDVRMDWTHGSEGRIQITLEDPCTILPDPDAKEYDPKYWKEFHKTYWLSLDEISLYYGESVAKSLESAIYSREDGGYEFDKIKFEAGRFGDTTRVGEGEYLHSGSEENNRTIRSIRVVERQQKRVQMCRVWVDLATGEEDIIPESINDEEARISAAANGKGIIRQLKERIRWTVVSWNVVLFDEWSPYEAFTLVPYFPFFRRGRPMGLVRNLVSPQDLLNKTTSQELHIVNSSANGGWIYEDGSLANMTDEEFAANSSTTGLNIAVSKGASFQPQRIAPNQPPTGVEMLASKAVNAIREISAVNKSMLGLDSAEVSGVAIQTKKSSGMVQLEVPMDNFTYSMKILARNVMSIIKKFYTDERVIRVVDYSQPEPEDQFVAVNSPQPDGSILNDLTSGNYDVVIAVRPARDTYEESQFAQAIELRSAGVMVPDDIVIEHSNLDNKIEVAKRVRDLTGQGEPSPEEVQIQAAMQEMEMQRIQLELQNLQIKGQLDQANAQLAMAKAQREMSEVGNDEEAKAKLMVEMERIRTESQMAVMKMQSDMAQKEMEIRMKLDIAAGQMQSKSEALRADSALKRITMGNTLAQQQMQHAERMEAAKKQAQAAKSKPKNTSTNK